MCIENYKHIRSISIAILRRERERGKKREKEFLESTALLLIFCKLLKIGEKVTYKSHIEYVL